MAKVRFISKANGQFHMQVEGAPGQQCLKANEELQHILDKIGIEQGEAEPTAEMYASAGRDPEAHNNL